MSKNRGRQIFFLLFFRYFLCEMVFEDPNSRAFSIVTQNIYAAVKSKVRDTHGDYGLAAISWGLSGKVPESFARPGVSPFKGQGHFHFTKGTSIGKSESLLSNFWRGTKAKTRATKAVTFVKFQAWFFLFKKMYISSSKLTAVRSNWILYS